MKKFIVILGLFAIFIPLSAVVAQNATPTFLPPTCSLDDIHKDIDDAIDTLRILKNTDNTDPIDLFNFLDLTMTGLSIRKAACYGLAFSGDKSTVTGVFIIPDGVYGVEATTSGAMDANIRVITGTCGAGVDGKSNNLFSLKDNQAVGGAERVFVSGYCSAVIEVSNVTAEWQLSFDKVAGNLNG